MIGGPTEIGQLRPRYTLGEDDPVNNVDETGMRLEGELTIENMGLLSTR